MDSIIHIIDIIITGLVTQGGLLGLLLSLSIIWILFREKIIKFVRPVNFSADESPKETIDQKIDKLILEHLEIKSSQFKVARKINDIANAVDHFLIIYSENNKKIEKLTEQLQEVNDERVDELKLLLQNYSTTMTELALALEKIKFALRSKLHNGEH